MREGLALLFVLLLLVVGMQLILDMQRGLDGRLAVPVAEQAIIEDAEASRRGGASESQMIGGGADGPAKRISSR